MNCETALRRLRSADSERVLWIDAICIDQNNISERNSQVRLMSLIYHQAEKVVAYLGESAHDSDLGMDFVLEDARSMRLSIDRPSTGLSSGIMSSPQQRAIDLILERPYFQRVWILQEIEVARAVDILIGDRVIEWEAFSRTGFYLETNKKMYIGSRYCGRPPTVIFCRDHLTVEKPKKLLQFLNDTRHCISSDPRDKIFALLGMTPEAIENTLAPDYGTSVHNTFMHVTKFLIARDNNLNVLSQVQGNSSVPDLPSWVPDWSSAPASNAICVPKNSGSPYKASLNLPARVSFSLDGNVLIVQGKALDTISEVGPVLEMGNLSLGATIQSWQQLSQTSNSHLNQDKHNAFMETIIASPPYADGCPFVQLGFAAAWYQTSIEPPSPGSFKDAGATIFNDRVNKFCDGRHFFVTEKGYIGLGPKETQVGDLVAVLLGGQVPFVLRGPQDKPTLVGECYVYSLMNGEALKDTSIELQEFYLR